MFILLRFDTRAVVISTPNHNIEMSLLLVHCQTGDNRRRYSILLGISFIPPLLGYIRMLGYS